MQLDLHYPALPLPRAVEEWRERMRELPKYAETHGTLQGFVKFAHRRLKKAAKL